MNILKIIDPKTDDEKRANSKQRNCCVSLIRKEIKLWPKKIIEQTQGMIMSQF